MLNTQQVLELVVAKPDRSTCDMRFMLHIWDAFTQWCVDQLKERVGVKVLGFGEFSFRKDVIGEMEFFNPMFVMMESYARSHGLHDRRPKTQTAATESVELDMPRIARVRCAPRRLFPPRVDPRASVAPGSGAARPPPLSSAEPCEPKSCGSRGRVCKGPSCVLPCSDDERPCWRDCDSRVRGQRDPRRHRPDRCRMRGCGQWRHHGRLRLRPPGFREQVCPL